MNLTESIADWKARNERNTERMRAAVGGLDERKLNSRPDKDTWSPAQVIEHLVITNRSYLPAMEAAIQRGATASGDPPIRFTFVGNFLRQAAGPNGNAPAPAPLHPSQTTIPLSIIGEWEAQQTKLALLLNAVTRIDLSRTRVWNPIIRILPMNLADCFDLIAAHTERHVGQIEQRVAIV